MLCIKSLHEEDRVYPLEGFKFSLGSAEVCDIVIDDGMLNDVHALLWVGKDFVTVMTVQDALVTVNGALVTDRAMVKVGGRISFADHEMELIEILTDPLPSDGKDTTQSGWMLISRNQEMKGQKIAITGECTIGRAKDNTICIPVISLSRHHATLTADESGLKVQDKESANGTFVNGKQLGPESVALQRGDIIAFDELEFLVHGPEQNIYSDQTSVRAVKSAPRIVQKAAPTAIDRQKISLLQHKPESFTERFQAIQQEQSLTHKTNTLAKKPVFWLAVLAVLVIGAAVITAFS